MQGGKVSLDQPLTPEENPAKMRRTTCDEEKDEKEEQGFAIWDCGSPLYDSYELACITHLIESHMMVLPYSLHGSKPNNSQFSYPEEVDSRGSAKRFSMAAVGDFLFKWMWKKKETGQRKEKTKKMKTGFSSFLDMVVSGRN
ncbi:hypothetical protein L6164_003994 [Bauhinia variegata]|uniref:Uncharacterized protein n=1 Tax=Bauhinia variegata TaxID=167791 RepID=A0ACB9Q3S3_BAUVA|nr:hypothetical protein L6164_003994 [Bauhinia variegata]